MGTFEAGRRPVIEIAEVAEAFRREVPIGVFLTVSALRDCRLVSENTGLAFLWARNTVSVRDIRVESVSTITLRRQHPL